MRGHDRPALPLPPSGAAARHTQSFLAKRFREIGFQPNKKFGQNFLIDLNLQRLIVETAELDRRDVVLEVGTGTGSLTAQMADLAGAVVTVEIDDALSGLAAEQLAETDNVRMLHCDALANKHRLAPEMMETLEAELTQEEGRRLKLVANLPYNIATPLVSNLLSLERPPELMVVTIQKELADRIASPPGSKQYGALSVWVQSQCDVEIVRVMAPSVFWPRPKVESAILRVALNIEKRARIAEREFFHDFVRAIFFHRRKFFRSVVRSAFKRRLDKAQVDEVLDTHGVDGTVRAEQLQVESILALSDSFREVAGSERLL